MKNKEEEILNIDEIPENADWIKHVTKMREEKERLKVIRVINSYTGKDGWGFDCVEANNGQIYHVKQEPDSKWKAGDDITKAEKEKE